MRRSQSGYVRGRQKRMFNLNEMLVAVECAEDEALHTERILLEKQQRTMNRENETQKELNTGGSGRVATFSPHRTQFSYSRGLRKRWRDSLATVGIPQQGEPSSNFKNILEELDELYNKRLPNRVREIEDEYKKSVAAEESLREAKIHQAEREHEQALAQQLAYEQQQRVEQAKAAAEAHRLAEEEQRKRAEEQQRAEQLKQRQSQRVQDVQKPAVEESHQGTPEKVNFAKAEPKAVQFDKRLQTFLTKEAIDTEIDKWKAKCPTLLHPKTDNDKQVAMKIKRLIAVPVGALTQRSGEDLKTQIKKIAALIDGEGLPNHPETESYAILCAAQRMVRLAEEQLASNEQAAPAAAAAAVALWNHDTSFGQVFMAHLYLSCPALLPKDPQPTEIDEATMRTYVGNARLLACMSASDCAPGSEGHPCGIEHLWKTLVSVLLLPTKNDLGPQIVYEILRYTGKVLSVYYKTAFSKLLLFIKTSYIPTARGGPAARLISVLDEVQSTGWSDPPGMLPKNFWTTKDEHTGRIVDH